MSGRLSTVVMVCIAVALMLTLVGVVAANASAQDGAIPDDGQGSWVRHNMPAVEDWQEDSNPNIGVLNPRYCAITLQMGPCETAVIAVGTADTSMVEGMLPRWLCFDGYYIPNENH